MSEQVDKTVNPWSRLRHAALLALICHFIAGLSMALILRTGLETNADLPSRLAFLSGHSLLWMAGWVPWNFAALSILYFYYSFYAAHSRSNASSALRLALIFATAALAADLSAEAIEMGVLPDLALAALKDGSEPALQSFLTMHRLDVMLTGYTANGLYSIAALLLACAARRDYPRWTTFAGVLTGIIGIGLSAAALFNSMQGLFWTNALLVPCLLAWITGVAVDTKRRQL